MPISGVASRHAKAIADVAREQNCFIFIRPSTADTVRLIEAGFATKSNDVHDKSSNWGPMAGFVPVDPGLNKKNRSPNSDKSRLSAGYRRHGIEQEVHLKITMQLAAQQPLRVVKHPGVVQQHGTDWVLVGSRAGIRHAETFTIYKNTYNPHPNDPLFARRGADGGMFWIEERSQRLIPIYVWGYHGVPITGDYDLWMVAPHIDNTRQHGMSSLFSIVTAVDEHKTPSSASPFLLRLNQILNHACIKAIPGSKQVFNHGAEAQNLGFTQALDDTVAMFSPGGTYRDVDYTELPRVLVEMEGRGYVAVLNKKWQMRNPTLGGERSTDGQALWSRARAYQLGTRTTGSLSDVSQALVAKQSLEARRGRSPTEDGWTWENPDKEKAYTSRLQDRRRLHGFGRELQTQASTGADLHVLKTTDFPPGQTQIGPEELARLRARAAQATATTTGAGANVSRTVTLDNSGLRTAERESDSRAKHIARIRGQL